MVTYSELRARAGLELMSVSFGWLLSSFHEIGQNFQDTDLIFFPLTLLEGALIIDFSGDAYFIEIHCSMLPRSALRYQLKETRQHAPAQETWL